LQLLLTERHAIKEEELSFKPVWERSRVVREEAPRKATQNIEHEKQSNGETTR
jgi:hypothetical protein